MPRQPSICLDLFIIRTEGTQRIRSTYKSNEGTTAWENRWVELPDGEIRCDLFRFLQP